MKPDKCFRQSVLNDFVEGRISNLTEFESIETHVLSCNVCADVIDTIRPGQLESSVSSVLQSMGPNSKKISDRYQLINEIGKGGTGIVYHAIQPGLNRPVALKMLLSGAHAPYQQIARLRRESQSLARLDHPNIVRVIDSGEQDGIPFLATELIVGTTLDRWGQQQTFDAHQIARILFDLSDAIESAHRESILHLDLKPQNVLVAETRDQAECSQPLVKIVDFGLTNFKADGFTTATGELLGTPSYLAPEMLTTQRNALGESCDVYGLGTILYQLITKRPPILGESNEETLRLVSRNEIAPIGVLNPSCPIDLQVICQKCLEKSPTERFPSAGHLKNELRRFIEGRPIESRPSSTLKRCKKWIRRHPGSSVAIAASVLVLACILSGLLFHQSRLSRANIQVSHERDVAIDNYQQTRESIFDILDSLESDQVNFSAKLQPVATNQLLEALALFERLHQAEQTGQSRLDLIDLNLRAGSALLANGQFEEGQDLLQEAERLLAQEPTGSGRQKLLGLRFEAVVKQAVALNQQGLSARSIQLLESNRSLVERLYDPISGNINDLDSVAWFEHTLANSLILSQRHSSAVSHLERAIELRSKALALATENGDIQLRLADSHNMLGLCFMKLGNSDGADAQYVASIELLERNVKQNPDNALAANSAAMTHLNRSNIFAGQNQLPKAIEICGQGIDVLESVLQDNPTHFGANHARAMLLGNRALFQQEREDYLSSRQDWQAAIDCAPEASIRNRCIEGLIDCHMAAQEYQAAISQTSAWLDQNLESTLRFSLIRRLGRAATQLEKKEALVTELRQKVEQQMSESFELLLASGYFSQNPRSARAILKSSSFELLRNYLGTSQLEQLKQ